MAVCDELADAALSGADPVRLTEVLARLVGKRIVLLDRIFRLRAQAGGSGSLRGLRWNRTDLSVERLLRALVVIVPGNPSAEALAALCRLGPGATCGVSEQVDSPELVPCGVRQAERAIDLELRLGRAGQLVRYDELGIYRLLCTIGDMRQLMGFARDVPATCPRRAWAVAGL